MAAVASLGTPQFLTNALSEAFENAIVRQMNRKSVLLSTLPIISGEGKRCAWDVEADTATAATYAEAAAVGGGEFSADEELPATLDWGLYRSALEVTGLAVAAAESSDRPSDLKAYWKQKLFGSVSKLGSKINVDLYTGTGANSIIGLHSTAGALLDTGTYAGIDRAVKTFWQGNILANGAVPRPITFSLMRDAIRAIYVDCGEAPDLIITDPIQWDKVAALYDTNRRWMTNTVQTAAGSITLAAGVKALEFDGIPVLRDKDHPAGKMSFLNSSYLNVKFLPTRRNQPMSDDGTFKIHDEKGQESGLPAKVEFLGKVGDTSRAFVAVYVQLVNRRPHSCAGLTDLS